MKNIFGILVVLLLTGCENVKAPNADTVMAVGSICMKYNKEVYVYYTGTVVKIECK